MSKLFKIYLGFIVAWILFGILGVDFLHNLGFLGTLILSVYYLVRLTRKVLRKLLWRIRTKLVLSYIFIGLIPLCLLAALFLLAFWTFMAQTTTEIFNTTLDGYLLRTKLEARELMHLLRVLEKEQLYDRWATQLPDGDRWLRSAEITYYDNEKPFLFQGKQPRDLPGWLRKQEFSGLVFRDGKLWLTSVQHDRVEEDSAMVQVEVTRDLLHSMGQQLDARIHYIPGTEGMKDEMEQGTDLADWPKWWDVPVIWLRIPDQYNWSTGEKMDLSSDERKAKSGITVQKPEEPVRLKVEGGVGAFFITTNVSRVYDHIFYRSTQLQRVLYGIMVAIALFFLLIEAISFLSGFLLAKSMTASVHNLFEGTERIKAGDLNYKIRIHAKDQLGDLAHSFNGMTDSVQNLLKVRAEKERLAESLQIARQMQQNLLPREITSVGGIDISTLNLPAQEVCGDYYDIIRKSDHELGIIIADVSGKGPSAALYMAEVKGVMLSMSQRPLLPREMLVEANRVLAPTLDSRNFITMSFATINHPAGLMRMCRAGHNPILHYSANAGKVEVVQPRGIGLGLGKNGIFERSLEEIERHLGTGDILVFYTDGLTEAMNEQGRLYGLPRLSDIVFSHREESSENIKNAILQDLQIFLRNNLPQDDITLVLLKM